MSSKNNIDVGDMKKLESILQELFSEPISEAFQIPVDHVAYGLDDYPKIVKKPMDLGTVRDNLKKGKYKEVRKVLDDIQLVWDNCKLYNQEGSEIYRAAQDLEKQTQELVYDNFDNITYGKNNPAYKDLTRTKLQTNISEQVNKNFANQVKQLDTEQLGQIVEILQKNSPDAFKEMEDDKSQILVDYIDKSTFELIQKQYKKLFGKRSRQKKNQKQIIIQLKNFKMNSNSFSKNNNNLQEEQLILCLSPIEIVLKQEEQLVQFRTQKFFFYGYKFQILSQTKESDNFYKPDPSSYIGLMLFTSGEVYIGEFDHNFRFHGEGMFFFAIGSIARGHFDMGKIHNNVIITLPNDNYIFAKFNKGSLSGEAQKINFTERQTEKLKYTMGEFKENLGVYNFEDQSLNSMIDKMSTNLIPDDIKDYKNEPLYFGSFLIENNQVYIGFIENGRPRGWGLKIQYNNLNYSFDAGKAFQPFQWTIKDWSSDGFQIDLQNDLLIFSNRINNQIKGQVAIYKLTTNTLSYGNIDEAQTLGAIMENSSEGLEKQIISKIVKEYLDNSNIPIKEFQNDFIVSMIFHMPHFKEIFFFYLYGSLKNNVHQTFPDNLKIFEVLKLSKVNETLEMNSLTDEQTESQIEIHSESQNRDNFNSIKDIKSNKISKKIMDRSENFSDESKNLNPKNFMKKDEHVLIEQQGNDIYRNPFERSEQEIKDVVKRNASRRSNFSNQLRYMYNDQESSMENNIMKLGQIQSSTENRPSTSIKKDIENLQIQRPKTSSYNQTKGLVDNIPKRQVSKFKKTSKEQTLIEEEDNQTKESVQVQSNKKFQKQALAYFYKK